MPYLVNRARHLKVDGFAFLGRIRGSRSTVHDVMTQSKQMGRRENKFTNIDGRVQLDVLQVTADFFNSRIWFTWAFVSLLTLSLEDFCHQLISIFPALHRWGCKLPGLQCAKQYS